ANNSEDRAAKRQKVSGHEGCQGARGVPSGGEGPRSVRIRHLLLRCAEPGKSLLDDPLDRRARGQKAAKAVTRSPPEAETEIVALLRELLTSQPDANGNVDVQRHWVLYKLIGAVEFWSGKARGVVWQSGFPASNRAGGMPGGPDLGSLLPLGLPFVISQKSAPAF
ncbi:unnamed protein product, partial [Polarella glacialis]